MDFASQSPSVQTLDEVLRVGALLYMQATLQKLPFAAVGSRNLVNKLKDSVMVVKILNQKEGELMVWLLFMGGIEARAWFVVQIRKLTDRLRMGWEEVNKALEGLWWVKEIHERARRLWDDVEIRKGQWNNYFLLKRGGKYELHNFLIPFPSLKMSFCCL